MHISHYVKINALYIPKNTWNYTHGSTSLIYLYSQFIYLSFASLLIHLNGYALFMRHIITTQHMRWSSIFAIIPVTISSIGIVLTLATIGIFVKNQVCLCINNTHYQNYNYLKGNFKIDITAKSIFIFQILGYSFGSSIWQRVELCDSWWITSVISKYIHTTG